MSKTKKIILMSGLVLLLAVTAVFNFILAEPSAATDGGTVTAANYFASYRAERSTTRSEELLELDRIIALYNEGDEKYTEAVNMKLKYVGIMEKELVLETMIKSLGFSDAVVSIGYDSDNVNVFINSAELNYDTALSIYKLLKNETGIVAGNVIIMPVYSEIS